MTARCRLVVLCVLDGWGIAPDSDANAVARARTPRLDALIAAYPHAHLDASGKAVGLPAGVMGNSEVGHLTMGAGRAEPQSLEQIDASIREGSFFANPALRGACEGVRERGTLHLMGLLSTGGVHADMRHLLALTELARREGVRRVAVHAFLDGRDMPPRSALQLLGQVDAPIATLHGRYFAMDRDKRWDRIERSYRAIVDAEAPRAPAAETALRECYADPACGDESLEPRVIGDGAPVADGDSVIFFNYRPDRARELTWALMQEDFRGFARRRRPTGLTFVTMTDYKVELPSVRVAFAPRPVMSMAQVLSDAGLRQYHVAETEKYAHVTYFFNGGREEPFAGEDRLLVPSPKITTYDLRPEMSAAAVADALVTAIGTGTYDFAIVNFANPDMVGHTGVFEAAVRAMEATDAAVGRVVDGAIAAGGCVLITSDHGNAEQMRFPDRGAHTQHTTNLVPAVYVAAATEGLRVRDGELSDVAPTLLELLGLPLAEGMTGRTLLERR